jgi:hypothetical protein
MVSSLGFMSILTFGLILANAGSIVVAVTDELVRRCP